MRQAIAAADSEGDPLGSGFLDPAVGELFRGIPPAIRRDGATLTDVRQGFAITLPEGAVVDPRVTDAVRFTLDGVEVGCQALPAGHVERLRYLFQTSDGNELSDDRRFVTAAGELPGRAIYSRQRRHNGETWFAFFAIVQAPDAFYRFAAHARQSIPPATRDHLVELASTMRPST